MVFLAAAGPPCTRDAGVVKAVAPIYPGSLPSGIAPFDVTVEVTLGEDGSVTRAKIYKSSGYPDADAAAIVAARASTYVPQVVACKPVQGDYLFAETFVRAPSPIASSACFHEATVTRAAPLNLNGLDRSLLDQPRTADVKVAVEPNGSVKTISIYRSSGYYAFDLAAARAARQSTYSPKLVDCKPAEGIYLFKATSAPGYGPP
ncbi:MAG TPA: TonB family protein [Candidatus Babeliales bacterium]|nr:TonB family protein [Candidatus Babeliales bacterium]